MPTLEINKGELQAIVDLPKSKSFANRALILGAISSKPITITNLPLATDVTLLIDALKHVGLDISISDSIALISNSFPACEGDENLSISVGEGGTTARFLAGLLLKGKNRYQLILGKRLKDRPWESFIQLVLKNGAYASFDNDILTIQGPLTLPVRVEVDCSETTQFATSLLLSFGDTSEVVTNNLNASESYWKLTHHMRRSIEKTDSLDVPLDWSSASYPAVFAALKEEIFFPGLQLDPFQADSKLFSILESLDAVIISPLGIRVYPYKKPIELKLDVSDCLDLVPALCFLAAHIPGTHIFSGIKNLALKESDRAQEMIKILTRFKRKAWTQGDALFVEGSREIISERISLGLPDDHRLVMTGTLFQLYHGGGSLSPSESVDKSYPDFFKILKT